MFTEFLSNYYVFSTVHIFTEKMLASFPSDLEGVIRLLDMKQQWRTQQFTIQCFTEHVERCEIGLGMSKGLVKQSGKEGSLRGKIQEQTELSS